jgi:hypothetical protein
MNSVSATAEYGIVVRRRALTERDVSYHAVLAAFETGEPLDADEELLTFGPSFGQRHLRLSRKG